MRREPFDFAQDKPFDASTLLSIDPELRRWVDDLTILSLSKDYRLGMTLRHNLPYKLSYIYGPNEWVKRKGGEVSV